MSVKVGVRVQRHVVQRPALPLLLESTMRSSDAVVTALIRDKPTIIFPSFFFFSSACSFIEYHLIRSNQNIVSEVFNNSEGHRQLR